MIQKLKIEVLDTAKVGTNPDEVVIVLSPAFGTVLNETICEIPLINIVRELCAGIEEEGMKFRFVKVFNSTDLAIMASQGSKLSGSGISIGIQSRGTVVIHQKDMVALDNLELLPQSPLYDERIYRNVGKNAAKYAKGEHPEPIEYLNDYMVPSKFLIKSTLLHFKEGGEMDKNVDAKNVKVSFE
ncbi:MAG: glycerol dehydratase reactivase beta/small subunit family protein [Anaerovoracaceae bacterium]